MPNIEIDPVTGAPIIKPKEEPTVTNPIMPVVAEPTASPGLIAGATTPVVSIPPITPKPLPTKPVMKVTATATVGDGDERHISTLYPGIQQALREGGGDTQQQAQTFAKIKELLELWADS